MAAPKKTTTTKQKSLADTLTELRGAGAEVGTFSEFPMMEPHGLSTGNLILDALTGIGGFPAARITELYGPYSSGKTTAALQCAAKVQQAGGIVVFLDYERSLDPVYCKALGLDVDDPSFIYVLPANFEDGINAFRKLCATGEVTLGIADSVAAMTTKNEMEADTGKVLVADRAKMLYQTCRQLVPLLARTGTGMIFLNHLLEKVDATFMGQQMAARGIKQYVTPGGKALGFYSSLRMEFKPAGNVKSEEMDLLSQEKVATVNGTNIKATVIKNKVADPFRTAQVRVRQNHGFSQAYSVFSVLKAHGVIKVKGAWFTFPVEIRTDDDQVQIQGEHTVLTMMENDPAWLALCEKKCYEILQKTDLFAGAPVDVDEEGEAVTYVALEES